MTKSSSDPQGFSVGPGRSACEAKSACEQRQIWMETEGAPSVKSSDRFGR